ncbi:hypothetical protein ACFQX4_20235 [Roseomonas sp. GCM10028921]
MRGLVAALSDGDGACLLAALSGIDLGGLARGADRRILILSIRQVLEEVPRLGVA